MIAYAKLAERYRPESLTGIVGQPSIKVLQAFSRKPYSSCWLMVGSPGTGKSATALALAADLGCSDPWSGLEVVCSADLGKDECQRQLRRLWATSLCGGRPDGQWNVLIIEELERLSPAAQVTLKVGLASENLPPRAVVLATSNDTSMIDPALLERFGRPLRFDGLDTLAAAGYARVSWIWAEETDGAPLPLNAKYWGWYLDEHAKPVRYSLRKALDDCQMALLLAESEEVAA